jgi:hypothetical protein
MSVTNKQKRKTRLVRIEAGLLQKLKYLAIEKSLTISKLLDGIVAEYFDKYINPKAVEQVKRDERTLWQAQKKKKKIKRNIGKRMVAASLNK